MIKMKNFLVSSFPQIATYATIIVIFTYNALFDREGACICQDQNCHCNVYIIVPIFIIFLLLLWKDEDFNGTCRVWSYMKKMKRSNKNICHLIFLQTAKALVISLLWVVSVLFEGDWYACCQNGLTEEKAQIPCKTNRTLEEQAIIDHLKNESKIIALYVLLVLLLLIVCFSLLKWCGCWGNWPGYIDGDGLYELIIIKEEENIVNEILKERAKEALKKKVDEILDRKDRNKYMDSYKPAQKVIDELWSEENQTSGSEKDNKAEIHEGVWKFTGNLSIIHSPGEKEKKEETSGDGQGGMNMSPVTTSSIHSSIHLSNIVKGPGTSADRSRTPPTDPEKQTLQNKSQRTNRRS